jgi:hypothetical protein
MNAAFARAGRLGLALLLGALLAACGAQQPAAEAPAATSAAGPLTPVLAVSELTLGPNRIAMGVLQNGTPVNDPELQLGLRFFHLDGADANQVQSESTAVYRGEGLPFGLYVGYATFDRPGGWGVEISVPSAGGEPAVTRMRLDVLEQPRAPAVGAAAIPSETLTVAQEPDLAKITSDSKPDPELYQLSVAEAITAGKPFLVAFSTPGYCQTAVCAPNQLVIKQLKDQYKAQVNFIHVEVYPYPFGESFQAGRRVPAMGEWNLRTEPWTFLVDANGVIQARYEGGVTFAELEPALAQLAAGEPITPPTR